MAIRTKNTKIFWLVVFCIAINVIYMQNWAIVHWVFFAPPTLFALVSARLNKVIPDGSL